MSLYLEDRDITDAAKQAMQIKLAIGDEGMRRLLASGLSDADQKKPTAIWTLLESQLDATVKINFRVHRLEFANLRQKPTEPTADFVSRLREKASKCEFEEAELNERLIEMLILSTPFEDFRKELLTKQRDHLLPQHWRGQLSMKPSRHRNLPFVYRIHPQLPKLPIPCRWIVYERDNL